MTHLIMLNGSNARLTSAIQQNGKKLDMVIAADSRVRALATPTPNLPSAFMGLLPIDTLENLEIVETLLSQIEVDVHTYREELVRKYLGNIYIVYTNYY